ncbi:MAG TPA: EamA family transporter [Longimicrobiales bacterium]|nr:EamA family transporter [Longimicrobiales bacterium]
MPSAVSAASSGAARVAPANGQVGGPGVVGNTAGDVALSLEPAREWLGVWAAFFAIYVVWGSTYLAIAVAVEEIPPLLMMGARSVLAGALLYGGARLRGAPAPGAGDWLAAARVGALFFVMGHGLLAWSETRVPSGVAAVLIATEPLFIVLLGWRGGRLVARSQGQRPGLAVLLALLLGLGGVAVLTLPGTAAAIDPAGAAGLLIASFAWSVGTFHVPRTGSPFRGAGMQLLAGGGMLLLLSTLLGEGRGWDPGAVGLEPLLAVGYLVTFGSVVAFGAYIWLLRRVSAARVASHTYVNPLIAVALGSWLGGEELGGRVLLAAGMVVTAVLLLVQRARQRA